MSILEIVGLVLMSAGIGILIMFGIAIIITKITDE